jgi:hypothetical protein
MRFHRAAAIAMALLLTPGCSSDNGDSADEIFSGSVGSDEINRYQLEFVGGIRLDHTGGLICSVDNGELVLDFSIDASDGEYEYTAGFPGFDPTLARLDGELKLARRDGAEASGPVVLTFGYLPAPAEYPGVVRAAGQIGGGPIAGTAGAAEVNGGYACFLMDSEVGT